MESERTRLAVWGDPIAHSRSPLLHAAAYAQLGLDWEYGRRRVDAAGFPAAFDELGPSWRGLSCTMPLKEAAASVCATRDRHAELTGSVNTIVLSSPDAPHGANTDVGGLVAAIREQGIDGVRTARILGAGRTAASAVVALSELGARRIDVHARRPASAADLVSLGELLGVDVVPALLSEADQRVDVTVSTLPGGARLDQQDADRFAGIGGALFDAAYDPWPTDVAGAWTRSGRTVVSGLSMLLHQALLQVRLFATGDVGEVLPNEPAVLLAMRSALTGVGD